jgi:hypothetical protein
VQTFEVAFSLKSVNTEKKTGPISEPFFISHFFISSFIPDLLTSVLIAGGFDFTIIGYSCNSSRSTFGSHFSFSTIAAKFLLISSGFSQSVLDKTMMVT